MGRYRVQVLFASGAVVREGISEKMTFELRCENLHSYPFMDLADELSDSGERVQQFPVKVNVDRNKMQLGVTRAKSFKEGNLKRQELLGKACLQFSKILGFVLFVISGYWKIILAYM